MGLLYGFIIFSVRCVVKDMCISMNWWRWFLIVAWFIFLNIGVAAAFTLYGEKEPGAGNYLLIITLLISVVWGVFLWRSLAAARTRNG